MFPDGDRVLVVLRDKEGKSQGAGAQAKRRSGSMPT
jgi:hypothetical protein